MSDTIRIGTRGSALALWQADHVTELLSKALPDVAVERTIIRTKGDQLLDKALSAIGDKGLFTKELERALLDDQCDIAVHSMKDVPTYAVPGLTLAAVPARGPVEDAFISSIYDRMEDLPRKATVATGSLRREAQLRHLRPDLKIVGIRGNVPTRLRKLDESSWDGMILATAGLVRLGLADRIQERLPADSFIPAVGQGALYIQAREGSRALELVKKLNDPAVAACVAAERRFMLLLEGGCQVPIGANANVEGDRIKILGFVASRDGTTLVRKEAEGPLAEPTVAGEALAAAIKAEGGAEILAKARAEGLEDGS